MRQITELAADLARDLAVLRNYLDRSVDTEAGVGVRELRVEMDRIDRGQRPLDERTQDAEPARVEDRAQLDAAKREWLLDGSRDLEVHVAHLRTKRDGKGNRWREEVLDRPDLPAHLERLGFEFSAHLDFDGLVELLRLE